MRKFIKTILTFSLFLSALSLGAQKGLDNPVTKAVLKVYDATLQANPKDYVTRLARAHEYYNHGAYNKALDDLNLCIAQTPGSNRDMRFEEVMLRASISRKTGRPLNALPDLNEAVSLKPQSIPALGQRAAVNFEAGNIADAKADYRRILAINPRSAEGLLGLGSVAIKENNLGIANEYLEQAVALDPNNSNIYVRRAEIKKTMGDHNGAVDDIIVAISNDSHNNRALDALAKYAETNYPATVAGLSNAIKLAPDNGLFRYLRAGIALSHYNYKAALDDYTYIINHRLYDYDGLYGNLAECQFAMGQYEKALENVDRALTTIYDRADLQILRSRILRALKRYDQALEAAAKATAVDRQSPEAIAQMGLCYVSLEKYKEANELFGEAILIAGENPRYMMLRAWVLWQYLNESAGAENFYNRVANLDLPNDDIRSLKGFALLFCGKKSEAIAWLDNILNSVEDNDGFIHYLAACFYCAEDDIDRALEAAKASMEKGYADAYNWNVNDDARINVAPLRNDLRFLNLLSRYAYLFE